MKSRRSIRNYKNIPVPREEVEKLLDITRFSPTGHNDQDVQWRVFDKKDTLIAIADSVVDYFRHILKTNPKPELPFDLEELIHNYEKGNDIVLRHAPVLLVTHSDKNRPMASTNCHIALTTMELAAKACGLGTCWAGFIMFTAMSGYKPLVKLLNLPEDQQFQGAMLLGYPKFHYKRIPARNKPVINWND